MIEHRVDYNKIAHLFDEPERDHNVDHNLLSFLSEHSVLIPEKLIILDIGCGTGKQLSANRCKFPQTYMVGLDLFENMLSIAKDRCSSVTWIKGDGAELPFLSYSYDYITNQFSYPHILEKDKLIQEVFRVLKPGGRFVMTNIDPWSMENWILYKYFPEARELDFNDFLTIEEFELAMKKAGFTDIKVTRDYRTTHEVLPRFLEYASHRHRTSHFLSISDEAYNNGVLRIKNDLQKEEKLIDAVESEFCLVTVAGDKPLNNKGM